MIDSDTSLKACSKCGAQKAQTACKLRFFSWLARCISTEIANKSEAPLQLITYNLMPLTLNRIRPDAVVATEYGIVATIRRFRIRNKFV